VRRWVAAEFADAPALERAGRAMHQSGWRTIDLHSPYPLEGVEEILELRPSRVRWAALLGGFGGAACGYAICWFTNAVQYPLNVGGRPLNAVPAFIPFTFEAGVLLAALAIFGAFLAITGLPRLYHPVFEVPDFEGHSIDAFWLSLPVEAKDAAVRRAIGDLERLGALRTSVVDDRRAVTGEEAL
jgi:hypothetical protein